MRSHLLWTALLTLGCSFAAPSGVEPEEEEAEEPGEEPPAPAPAVGPNRARTVYVPAYSSIGPPQGRPTLLEITLSVRNVDPGATVTLTHVDYYDTSGHRVRRYLRAPRPLQPLETVEFFVAAMDEAGGSGANFLVYWEGPDDAQALMTETVMVGHAGGGHYSFTSRGVELDRAPVLPAVRAQ
ncbi:MAG: DUF3124 domain-containing protein [Sandaracinaceae bacterium]|nr:hypothetical protein [Myxococcales bacterium]